MTEESAPAAPLDADDSGPAEMSGQDRSPAAVRLSFVEAEIKRHDKRLAALEENRELLVGLVRELIDRLEVFERTVAGAGAEVVAMKAIVAKLLPVLP